MSAPPVTLQDVAAEWRAARRVYTVYAAIQKSFVELAITPCEPLESPIDRADDSLRQVRDWLAKMDACCTAAQIRQVLHHSNIGTAPVLRSLIHRFLNRPERTEEDRNKLDFLLVQYFAECAPRSVILGKVELEDVAQVLEPVIGESPLTPPRFLEPLKALIERITTCTSLRDLIRLGVLESGRKLKEQSGSMYFGTSVLVAFTRYNFLVRRAFVQLVHADLEAIRSALRQLEIHAVTAVDCSAAGFGAQESIADIRRYCRTWRSVFVGDYASGPSFRSIAEVRQAVEAAVHAARLHQRNTPKAPVATPPAAPEDSIPAEPASVAAPPEPERSISSEVAEIEDARARVTAAVNETVPATASSLVLDLQAVAQSITEQITNVDPNASISALNVKFGSATVVLSAWEILAFAGNATDPIASALQRGVSIRAVLVDSLDRLRNSGNSSDLTAAISSAHAQAVELQQMINRAREASDLNTAVNLAATAKMLRTVLEKAEGCLKLSK